MARLDEMVLELQTLRGLKLKQLWMIYAEMSYKDWSWASLKEYRRKAARHSYSVRG